ncbi:MAG: hypothetical protein IT379_02340 [Deltaproteobacteria bacterium]|nr:hypothetical protein [Deltaproteobacteria bacterium]
MSLDEPRALGVHLVTPEGEPEMTTRIIRKRKVLETWIEEAPEDGVDDLDEDDDDDDDDDLVDDDDDLDDDDDE